MEQRPSFFNRLKSYPPLNFSHQTVDKTPQSEYPQNQQTVSLTLKSRDVFKNKNSSFKDRRWFVDCFVDLDWPIRFWHNGKLRRAPGNISKFPIPFLTKENVL